MTCDPAKWTSSDALPPQKSAQMYEKVTYLSPTVTVFFHALCDCPSESQLYRRTQPRSRRLGSGAAYVLFSRE